MEPRDHRGLIEQHVEIGKGIGGILHLHAQAIARRQHEHPPLLVREVGGGIDMPEARAGEIAPVPSIRAVGEEDQPGSLKFDGGMGGFQFDHQFRTPARRLNGL